MSRSAEKLFTWALHSSYTWEVFSVNIDDTEAGVDSASAPRAMWSMYALTADVHARAMMDAKGPGSTWISSTWDVISIVPSLL